MANNDPVQIIVAAFKDETGAEAALQELKEGQKQGLIKIQNAAVVRKDESSKLHVKDTGDMTGTKGAVIGGVTGAVVGILAGPVGWAAVGGAAIGGLAAKLRDGGFEDKRLRQLGEGLQPGNSAIVAVVEHTWVSEVEKAMTEAGGDIVTEELSADIARQLDSGAEPVYTAIATNEGVIAAATETPPASEQKPPEQGDSSQRQAA